MPLQPLLYFAERLAPKLFLRVLLANFRACVTTPKCSKWKDRICPWFHGKSLLFIFIYELVMTLCSSYNFLWVMGGAKCFLHGYMLLVFHFQLTFCKRPLSSIIEILYNLPFSEIVHDVHSPPSILKDGVTNTQSFWNCFVDR